MGLFEDKTRDIQKCFEDFYTSLYAQQEVDNDGEFWGTLNLPGVTEEQSKSLIAEITDEEINRAISNLKVGKSPGADGYTADWYRSCVCTLTHSELIFNSDNCFLLL